MGTSHGTRDTDHAVPLRWYRPVSGATSTTPTLLWLHGGGFFRGSPDLPEAHIVAQVLARQGMVVATAGYRLAPLPGLGWVPSLGRQQRVRFPVPLDDVLAAYREVRAAAPGGVILGGASAGACLAAAAALSAVDEGVGPAGAVFAYGFFHAAHPRTRDSQHRSQRHRRVTHARWALDAMNRSYAGSSDALTNRRAFPGGHDVGGFPPTLLVNAEHDTMRASGDLFATELRDAGVDVEHHVLPGTRHAFLNRPGLAPFDTAVSMIVTWSRGGALTG